jgi:SAM-dependent methyltransferase
MLHLPRTDAAQALSLPEETVAQVRKILTSPPDGAARQWMADFLKSSGAYTDQPSLRVRLMGMVWHAFHGGGDEAWSHLMWFNQNEAVISDHLIELLGEALADLECHVHLTEWLAAGRDERLTTFFGAFRHVPGVAAMPDVLSSLLTAPASSRTGRWLAAFCRDATGNPSPAMEPWCLLATAWFATLFDQHQGLTYLQKLNGPEPALSYVANQRLLEAASQIGCVPELLDWIAACPGPAVQTMLKDLIHPELATLSSSIINQPPAYEYLAELDHEAQATQDLDTFRLVVKMLAEAGLAPKATTLLEVGCGSMASLAMLLSSAGYKTVGVDFQIPPGYLPLAGPGQWLKRGKHVKAWQAATEPYFRALAQKFEGKFKTGKAKIQLADLTRLKFAAGSFDAVLSVKYLPYAPDVPGLLAEMARVLKPGGAALFRIPFNADRLHGASLAAYQRAWNRARKNRPHPLAAWLTRNRWDEATFRTAIEQHFVVEQWLPGGNEPAGADPNPLVVIARRP